MTIQPSAIISLRMERQYLLRKANELEYDSLYQAMQPGQNVYWNGFGNPPSISHRASFDDMEYNRERQRTRALIKGRFAGGTLGWIMPEDLALFAAAFRKPLDRPTPQHIEMLELIEAEGPLTIQQIKAETGMLVKGITPILHRLQEAFLIYEDQYDGEWDRGWYRFAEMFPDIDVQAMSRQNALKTLLQRFAYLHVVFDIAMAKSFYRLPEKDLKAAVLALVGEGVLLVCEGGYMLQDDCNALSTHTVRDISGVFAMHRNDFMVKSNEHWLKVRFTHGYPDSMYYLLVDGEFQGVVAGKFRYTPEIEDIILDMPFDEAQQRQDAVLHTVRALCGSHSPIKRYMGVDLPSV